MGMGVGGQGGRCRAGGRGVGAGAAAPKRDLGSGLQTRHASLPTKHTTPPLPVQAPEGGVLGHNGRAAEAQAEAAQRQGRRQGKRQQQDGQPRKLPATHVGVGAHHEP